MLNNYLKYYFSTILIIVFISICIFIYVISYIQRTAEESESGDGENQPISGAIDSNYYFNNGSFFWPVPGYHRITSPFGPRRSPTAGSSSNHSGIDIAVPEGGAIYSVITGKVTFVGFKGAGGCTITTSAGNLTISYCHVSPNYIVSVGQIVNAGQHIGNVGPKIIYGIPGNPYKDGNRESH